MQPLERSYKYCREVARRRARNFYYSFVLLPREQRNAMCAIYAFMRRSDDLSDEPGAERAGLERWRSALDSALRGIYDGYPGWPAFHDTVQRYQIPQEYFHEMIEGVASDMQPRRVQTFQELYGYCYQVASVVGLTTVHIFGFDSPDALPLAEKCGVAFQLTNILRDLREDAGRGRIYLPSEDLLRFGVSPEDIESGRRGKNFSELMRFEVARARAYYDESQPLLDMVHTRSRPALRALIGIYSQLLEQIERSGYDVYSRRVSISTWEKWRIVLRAYAGGVSSALS